jgi:hydroxymethylpyrimidine/phosphomethylpyrimidine kinase
MKHVLTIAGSDSSGGAGIQADLKTFSAHGTFGMSVITAITAQSTRGVFGVQDIEAQMIQKQLEVIFEDIKVHGIKIGMVSSVTTIKTIAGVLKNHREIPLVLDPVMVSKSGYNLLELEAKVALIENLLPLATIVTPNLPEAEVILGEKISNLDDMKRAGEKIYKLGPKYVLMKGGHLEDEFSTDVLYDGCQWTEFVTRRIDTKNTHGTGCTLSASLCSNIAKGLTIEKAVAASKAYVTKAIENSFSIGQGPGPVHHFHNFYNKLGEV